MFWGFRRQTKSFLDIKQQCLGVGCCNHDRLGPRAALAHSGATPDWHPSSGRILLIGESHKTISFLSNYLQLLLNIPSPSTAMTTTNIIIFSPQTVLRHHTVARPRRITIFSPVLRRRGHRSGRNHFRSEELDRQARQEAEREAELRRNRPPSDRSVLPAGGRQRRHTPGVYSDVSHAGGDSFFTQVGTIVGENWKSTRTQNDIISII